MSFSAQIAADATLISAHLARTLCEFPALPVVDAMRYAVAGGKRIRGFLVLESARLFDIAPQNALSAAAAIEMLHAYSLVHDDLPAMDNDDLRRGQPTLHIKWGEATAILAGDALHTLAFELLADPDLGPVELCGSHGVPHSVANFSIDAIFFRKHQRSLPWRLARPTADTPRGAKHARGR